MFWSNRLCLHTSPHYMCGHLLSYLFGGNNGQTPAALPASTAVAPVAPPVTAARPTHHICLPSSAFALTRSAALSGAWHHTGRQDRHQSSQGSRQRRHAAAVEPIARAQPVADRGSESHENPIPSHPIHTFGVGFFCAPPLSVGVRLYGWWVP